MLIYHASDVVVSQPDVLHSRKNLDFGVGFYATSLKEQAERYAQRFLLHGHSAVVNIYNFQLFEGLKVQQFKAYNNEWLDFVMACRTGDEIYRNYDIISGDVANDRIFNTLDLYFSNLISKKEALKRLSYEKPNQQFCFVTQKAIECCLIFLDSFEVKK